MGNRLIRMHRGLLVGGIITGFVLLTAFISWFWTPYPVADTNMDIAKQGASAAHWLGTDSYGRDMLSQLMVGAQASIAVGLIAVGIGLTLGTALGLLAAKAPGWLRELIMRSADFTLAFPAILSAILLTAIYGPSMTNAIVVENVFYLPGIGRLVFQSIGNRDLIVVQNVVMLLAALVIVVNFVVDVAQAWIDPRVRTSAL